MQLALKQFRCDMGLTQAEIAEKTGVKRQTYGNVEQGRRTGTVEFWQALQHAFNIPLDLWLVIQKGDIKAYNEKICTDDECMTWFKEMRLQNAR